MLMSEISSKVAGEVRAELARQKKTRAELAAAIGCSPAHAQKLSNGSKQWSLKQISAAAEFLGRTPESLILGASADPLGVAA
jgi:transcriptional regulator with XRE-family HTH domain